MAGSIAEQCREAMLPPAPLSSAWLQEDSAGAGDHAGSIAEQCREAMRGAFSPGSRSEGFAAILPRSSSSHVGAAPRNLEHACDGSEASKPTWQVRVSVALTEPDSGTVARVLSHILLYAIIGSLVCFVLETHPSLRDFDGWYTIEMASTLAFTLEFGLRFLVAGARGEQTKCGFLRTPMNIVDFLAIMPFYVELCLSSFGPVKPLRVLRCLRLVRVFRIFKLGKFSAGMNLMAESLLNSVEPLITLSLLLGIGVLFFSSLLYYAERASCPDVEDMKARGYFEAYQRECEQTMDGWSPGGQLCCNEYGSVLAFESITATFWWSIVTIATVGYGDKVPITGLGKCVACVAMLSGIVLISLPVAIVGGKFEEAYDNWEFEQGQAGGEEGEDTSKNRVAWELRRMARLPPAEEEPGDLQMPDILPLAPKLSTPGSCSHEAPGPGFGRNVFVKEILKQAMEQNLSMWEVVQRIRAKLLRLLKSEQCAEAGLVQKISLLLELLEHIEVVEKRLQAMQDEDAVLGQEIRSSFTLFCSECDAHGRAAGHGDFT